MAACHFFAVKNLPFVDIPADRVISMYAYLVKRNVHNTT